MAKYRREHGRLVIVLKAYYKLSINPSLLRDAAHTCWEAIQPAVVDFPHAWAVCTRDAATDAGGRHGQHHNARYALVKSTLFLFFLRVFAHGPYSWIAVK